MSAIPGTNDNECDRCGESVGNASLNECVVISDIDPDDPGLVRNYHLCRTRLVDGEEVKGCAGSVLTVAALKHLADKRSKAGQSKPTPPPSPEITAAKAAAEEEARIAALEPKPDEPTVDPDVLARQTIARQEAEATEREQRKQAEDAREQEERERAEQE